MKFRVEGPFFKRATANIHTSSFSKEGYAPVEIGL